MVINLLINIFLLALLILDRRDIMQLREEVYQLVQERENSNRVSSEEESMEDDERDL
jgi:sRNA-binding carbon storage regulator CsrA